jgi:hypothetical protein
MVDPSTEGQPAVFLRTAHGGTGFACRPFHHRTMGAPVCPGTVNERAPGDPPTLGLGGSMKPTFAGAWTYPHRTVDDTGQTIDFTCNASCNS